MLSSWNWLFVNLVNFSRADALAPGASIEYHNEVRMLNAEVRITTYLLADILADRILTISNAALPYPLQPHQLHVDATVACSSWSGYADPHSRLVIAVSSAPGMDATTRFRLNRLLLPRSTVRLVQGERDCSTLTRKIPLLGNPKQNVEPL